MLHDKDSRGALAYLALAGELIRRDDPDSVIEEPVPEIVEATDSTEVTEAAEAIEEPVA